MALERSQVGSPYRNVRTPQGAASNVNNLAVFQSMAALGSKVSLSIANNMEAQNERDAVNDVINDTINPDRAVHEAAYAGVIAENEALVSFNDTKDRINNGEFDNTDPEDFQGMLRDQHKATQKRWSKNPHSDIAMDRYNKTVMKNESTLTAGQAGKWRITLGNNQSQALQTRIAAMSQTPNFTSEDYQAEIESGDYSLVKPDERAASAILGAADSGIKTGSATILMELDEIYGFSTDRTLGPMFDSAMKSVTRSMQAVTNQKHYETLRGIDEAVASGNLQDVMYLAVKDMKTTSGSPVVTPAQFAAKMLKSNIKRAGNVVQAQNEQKYIRGVDMVDATQANFDSTVDAQFEKDIGAEGVDIANINLGRFLVKQTKVSKRTKARFGKLGRLEPVLNNEVNPEFIQAYHAMANFEDGLDEFTNGDAVFAKYAGDSLPVFEMFKDSLASTIGTPEEAFKNVANTLTRQRDELADKKVRASLNVEALDIGKQIADETVDNVIPWYVPDSVWSFFQKEDPGERIQVKAAKAYQEALDAGFSDDIAMRTSRRQAAAGTEMFNGRLVDVGPTPMATLMGLNGGTADEAFDTALNDPELNAQLLALFGETLSEAATADTGFVKGFRDTIREFLDLPTDASIDPEDIRKFNESRAGELQIIRKSQLDPVVNRENGTLDFLSNRDGETFMSIPLQTIGEIHNKSIHGTDEIDNLDSYYSEAYGNTQDGQEWQDTQGDLNDKFVADDLPRFIAEGADVPTQEEYAGMTAQEQTKLRKVFYKDRYEGAIGTIKQIGEFFGLKAISKQEPTMFQMSVTSALDTVIQGSTGDEISGGVAPITEQTATEIVTAPTDTTKVLIQQHEGLRLKSYNDSLGKATIGYGHLIKKGETFPKPFTKADAQNLFEKDYKMHSEAAQEIPGFVQASSTRQAALIDLTFNMGPAWYKSFPAFSKAFAAGDYKTAADELVDSKYYKQTGSRAKTIVSMIREG